MRNFADATRRGCLRHVFFGWSRAASDHGAISASNIADGRRSRCFGVLNSRARASRAAWAAEALMQALNDSAALLSVDEQCWPDGLPQRTYRLHHAIGSVHTLDGSRQT